MKIDILLPTQYITKNGTLANLDKKLLSDIEVMLIGEILKYESGVMKSKIEGVL